MKLKELKQIIKEEAKRSLKEGFATPEGRNLDLISRWLKYNDFEEFIGDNPGCYEAIISWIDGFFASQLAEEHLNPNELEKVGLIDAAEKTKESLDREEDFLRTSNRGTFTGIH